MRAAEPAIFMDQGRTEADPHSVTVHGRMRLPQGRGLAAIYLVRGSIAAEDER